MNILGKFAVLWYLLAILLTAGCVQNIAGESRPPDRNTAIPHSAAKILPEMDPLPPLLHIDDFETPVPLSTLINTAGAEDSPFITPDGTTLYFFFTPDPGIPPEKQLVDGVTGVYASRRVNESWGIPQRIILQDPGKPALDGCVFVLGQTMWFCSAREGFTGMNMFTAELSHGKWSSWRYTGDTLNRKYQVGELHISSDEKELYFHSLRSGGRGGLDLWVSRFSHGEWQEPENIIEVNTADNEGWPFLTQDGGELWFSRTYQGTPAIYRSVKREGIWQIPELIIAPCAAEPSLDENGNLYFAHHFLRNNTLVEADIYVAHRK